ncbi:hypothetical protein BD408DRAFT_425401 [Parasitella parasitica]|nr:hypothetical protein BD408DRAFT_425401 [Parasitella parasitica]
MNVLHSHLSTLFSLWTSVDLDTCSMNSKLHNVIHELEKLIMAEKREKMILAANIEDAMTSVDLASQLLGVSLENMLYSSISNEKISISPETLSMYNSLNPTFPKQKALIELDSRLTHEISTRQHYVDEWLISIQKLCKILDIPYRFKSIEEYHENDLSWATVQSISCELRDLKEIEACRIQQFNSTMKSIHYYWHVLHYQPNINHQDNTIETNLFALYQNFPLDVDLSMVRDQYELSTFDYYRHPSNQLQLTTWTLDLLYKKQRVLQSLYDARIHVYNHSTTRIKAVWEEFNIPILERPTLPLGLSNQNMIQLQEIMDSIDPLVKSVFDKYIQQFKVQLIPLWDACLLSQVERAEFIASLYEKNTKLEIKSQVDHHMTYLTSIHIEGQALKALMKERKDLIQKMIDFEKTASDPKRLFQASFQLLEEEKWRNNCLPRLLYLDRQLIKAINEFEKLAGKPVMIGERRYLDTLLDEIADREANQTFFGFLNSDPVQAQKRAKSRPASVGSLGSIMQAKKPHQLKTRAISAIMTSVVSNTQSVPKKIKPSQSMPLKKKPVVKSPIPQEKKGQQQQQQQQQEKQQQQEQEQPQNQGEIYSSTAYINSNITLTKAFRQKGQMASLIPIPASRALTTTKSV